MSQAIQAGLHLLGRGIWDFDRWDANGATTGRRMMGNIEDSKLNATTDKVEKRDFTLAAAPVAVSALTKINGEFTGVLDEHGADNFELFFLGTTGTVAAQTGGSFSAGTPDTIMIPATWPATLDRHIALTKRAVSALVVKNSGQTVTYVSGIDYELVDATRGLLYIPTGSAIALGANIKAEYAYGAVAARRIVQIAQQPIIEGTLRFRGVPGYGPVWDANLWKVRIGGDGDMSLIQADDFGTFTLKATLLSDAANHPDNPYGTLELVA